jgi:hypothetical protein
MSQHNSSTSMSPVVDLFDLEALCISPVMLKRLGRKIKPPHHRPGSPFILGPIPYTWISTACRLPGSGLHVAMIYRFHRNRFQSQRWRVRWSLPQVARGLRIFERTARRGLHAAELAGLLKVEREPGCDLEVSTLELPTPDASQRPLSGPIPWSWWLPASRLSGRSLQVGAVCWLLAGWEQSAEFSLVRAPWSDFGLSRFSAYRGLQELKQTGLIEVTRASGRSPIVMLQDQEAGGQHTLMIKGVTS